MTKEEIFNLLRPVGSFYETSDTAFDPSTAGWYGTWEEETEQRALISGNGTTEVGSTGGENTVALTTATMPGHTHSGTMIPAKSGLSTGTRGNTTVTSYWNSIYNSTSYFSSYYGLGTYTATNTGSGTAHENRQPYIIVRRFRRTA